MDSCNHCSSVNIKFIEHLNFSYWYCCDCKKEVEKTLNEFEFTLPSGCVYNTQADVYWGSDWVPLSDDGVTRDE